LEAEALLILLSERGVCAAGGSACSSGSLEPSPVLLAMGVPEAVAHGSIRLSLGRFTTEAEIDEAGGRIIECVRHLGRSLV
jgi:cysteine desulfurase